MDSRPIWKPSPQRVAQSRMTAFMHRAQARWGLRFGDYSALHTWSIEYPDQFWLSVWEFCGVIGDSGERVLLHGERMPGTEWFPDARLNFAENLIRRRDGADALVFWGEEKVRARISHRQLHHAVAQSAAAMRARGVERGDRIVAYMPNLPATLVIMLAAASIGAVFSSASPDFGVQGVLDRFAQIEPKLLFACDGYYYGGKTVDCQGKLAEIAGRLPTLDACVLVPYVGAPAKVNGIAKGKTLADFLAPHAEETEIEFEQLPFDHPLYIMYSSGTTGVPKCIVHGAGGVLLQHLKEHQLHGDVRLGDRLFYFTTCSWMMWNWLVSGLASGATLLLYDGSPFAARGNILFDYAEAESTTHFGISAKYIDAAAKLDLDPARTHDLEALRVVFSTGSPLQPAGFDFVYDKIKRDVNLASISGGTDIVSCFVLGNPILPVWRGEIQCRGLGMAVEVFDERGRPVSGHKGELVCLKPFPVMPVEFWNDPDGAQYRAAYFARFDGVWCHGDYAELTDHGGCDHPWPFRRHTQSWRCEDQVTAEIYCHVESLPEIVESLAIGQQWQDDVRIVLFVKLRDRFGARCMS